MSVTNAIVPVSMIQQDSIVFTLSDEVLEKVFNIVLIELNNNYIKAPIGEVYKRFVQIGEVCKKFNAIQCKYESNLLFKFDPIAKCYRVIVQALEKPMKQVKASVEEFTNVMAAQSANLNLTFKQAEGQIRKCESKVRSDSESYCQSFKELVKYKNITLASEDFEVYYESAAMMLRINLRDFDEDKKSVALSSFQIAICSNLISDFANQPLANVTPYGFIEYRDKLPKLYNNMLLPMFEKEADMRNAILSHPVRLKEFDKIIQEFKSATKESPHFIKARKAFQDRFEENKMALELKLIEILGKDGLEEKIKTVAKEIESTRIKLQDAFENKKGEHVELVKTNKELMEAYKSLLKQLDNIGEFEFKNGKLCVVGGTLFEVNEKLNPEVLDCITAAEMEKMADFYSELKKKVTVDEAITRSNSLHRIIHRNPEI
jgi:tetratricopeptide (TPR) repeat protein